MASAGSMRISTARITPSSPVSPRAGRHLPPSWPAPRLSQTTVCDTGGSATPASRRQTALDYSSRFADIAAKANAVPLTTR